jgi:hypothetical protein
MKERRMATIVSNLRLVIVAGLIAGLSAANFSDCGPDGMGARSAGDTFPSSHVCTCILKTGHCSCGAACHCGRHLPQKNNDPAAPTSSNVRVQPLGLATYFAVVSQPASVAFDARLDLNALSPSGQTLIAQGTRLNV